jgi:murein DD-endopeptidase MepM/ murein hydrolase activator NlpD
MRKLTAVLVLLVLAALVLWIGAGFLDGPAIQITQPGKFVGVSTPVEVLVDAPDRRLSSVVVTFEQDGTSTPLFSFQTGGAASQPDAALAAVEGAEGRVRIAAEVGRKSVPSLKSGAGRIVVRSTRPVLYGLREVQSEAAHDVVVRLERPRVSVISTHHYINHGGSEVVVYRVAPEDVESGVLVGGVEYPGYPAAGAAIDGHRIADPAVRIAFFALRHDQPLDTRIHLYARDEAGNSGRADFDYRIFPKPVRQSRIEVSDALLDRVVPAILAGTTEVAPSGSPIEQFVVINSELRRRNAEKIASFARETAPELLWRGMVFHPYTNSSAESAFADQRTYLYKGKEVDRQVHLGFDLASFTGTPIVAANRGRVLFADELGIYGNCVILDHGFGVQSLYAHLSIIGVKPGDLVEKEQQIGRSGMTGLAGGDHLHFTMLINGQMVNPIEWWDSHWIEDRILRKLRSASSP